MFLALMGGLSKVEARQDGYLVLSSGSSGSAWVPTDVAGRFRAARGDGWLTFDFDSSGRAIRYRGAGYGGAWGAEARERAGPLLNPDLFTATAVLTLLVALANWIGVLARVGSSVAPSTWQRQLRWGRLAAAALWLVAFAATFALLSLSYDDLLYDWPAMPLVIASTAALLATVLAIVLALATPLVLGRRKEGEGGGRMATIWHVVTLAVFALFSLLVWARGGLWAWG